MKNLTMGSLYLDGEPLPPGYHIHEKTNLSLGNTAPGRAIQWVQVGELLVADRCICTGVSWDDLDALGYILGNPVCIYGTPYTCRSLRLWGTPNEWDEILNQCGTDDEIWHWKNTQFWGDGDLGQGYCAACSGTSSRALAGFPHGHRSQNVGFRPVIKPLAGMIPDPIRFIGKRIIAYGPKKTSVVGILVQYDEYDLVLEGEEPIFNDCHWAIRRKGHIIADRKSVAWIEKV